MTHSTKVDKEMFYQVIIETNEKIEKTGKNKKYFELDKSDLSEIINRIVRPFILKEDFQFDGYFLKYNEIRRIAIKKTSNTSEYIAAQENARTTRGVLRYVSPRDAIEYDKYTTDITNKTFDSVKESISDAVSVKTTDRREEEIDKSKIFIVHGRDSAAKLEVARFVENMKFSAVILHEQANIGATIIEKIETNTNVGFAIILYTPCDLGGLIGEKNQKARARQNVVFEHGYLMAKLRRNNVCALVKGDVEVPTDISGIVYIPMDSHGAWKFSIAKEMRSAGYSIDMNMII